ncbi:MAG TPA: sugar phosphate nucleotidyltransferase [Candidatus Binataceae bacterium]|nr:sugar phosphate nucleotidyltransferase [Candidatus Binataceae bacterium]
MASRRGAAAALIIAGGSGTRFWPASRAARPKPLFSVDGKRSLLANTVLRLQPRVPSERIFVLVAASHAKAFRRELKGLIPARNLIIEPAARGTAVAIVYGVAVIERRLGQGVIAVMPADHLIDPAAGFRATLADAVGIASKEDSVVVIGVPPTRPEPGLGYQKIGRPFGKGFVVEKFIEKPAPKLALSMVRSGKYLWNAGMFVMSTRTLASELRKHCPALARAAKGLAAKPVAQIARRYQKLSFDSFDREVVEKSTQILGVRARFRWHDVGSWEGLRQAIAGHEGKVLRGEVIALDSDRVVAHSDSRLLVLLGVKDLIVVDTGDAILVADRSRSQELRRATEELARRGLHRYL